MSWTGPKLKLYHYWRSSSSWRVRWALALKNIPYETVALDLLKGETETPEHLKRNPLGYVPALDAGGKILCESLSIIHWLDETQPEPSVFPKDYWARAQVRMLAEVINADTQPIQNPGVAAMHTEDPGEQKKWMAHWTENGLRAYEALVKPLAGRFSVGDQVTLADMCLIPQCYNARRQEVPLENFPTVLRIFEEAMKTPACQASAPERFQPKV
jgi:maleylacetoacetate isomerase